MEDISEIIGNNPRVIKRFVNVYRVIKAHEEFNYDKNFEKQELMIILFLIALPLGKFRKLANFLKNYLNEGENGSKMFNSFLDPVNT
jgi:hypothetical protein